MSVQTLVARRVAKPWGRRTLWAGFSDPAADELPVGEIWFEPAAGQDLPLLVKLLFTSHNHSVQVHPDDSAARARGLPRGKDEAWLVLAAEPDARIALGLAQPLAREELARVAADGTIVDLLDWRPLRTGDFVYVPAGTIHTLSGGLTLLEVQQNCDVTYRLYDFGRGRPLDVEAAVAAASIEPFDHIFQAAEPGTLASGPRLTIDYLTAGSASVAATPHRPTWLVPLAEGTMIDGIAAQPGECLLADADVQVEVAPRSSMLCARPS